MNFFETKLNSVYIAKTEPIVDSRGVFSRLFCKKDLKPIIGGREIVQINYSRTDIHGAIRGLHFQYPPHSEMKLIRCLKGRVWDVVVDLRQGSPTFLEWHAEELSPDNAKMVIIPEGFAHGFQSLDRNSELLYLHTEYYTPNAEGGLLYDDPLLNVQWPLPATHISARDRGHHRITNKFTGIKV